MLEKWRAIPRSIWGGTTFRQGRKVGKEEREEMGRGGEKGAEEVGDCWTREGDREQRFQHDARRAVFAFPTNTATERNLLRLITIK